MCIRDSRVRCQVLREFAYPATSPAVQKIRYLHHGLLGAQWFVATIGVPFQRPALATDAVGGSRPASRSRNRPEKTALVTLPSESVSHNWLYFVVVVAVDKWEAAFCFPLIHSLFSSVARRQLAIAAVLRFQSCSNCVGLT